MAEYTSAYLLCGKGTRWRKLKMRRFVFVPLWRRETEMQSKQTTRRLLSRRT